MPDLILDSIMILADDQIGEDGPIAIDEEGDIAVLRAFNRVYTSRLGLLNARLDKSPFTLTEARILYELANRNDPTGAEIARALQVDPAQVSRTLKRFGVRGLVVSRENPSDGRHQLQALTDDGRAAFARLDECPQTAIGALLDGLPCYRRRQLIPAACTITRILEDERPLQPVLRGLRAGDLGMVTARQAILYADEFGWDADYEALVARILADFHRDFDPARSAGWIAEADDRMIGSVFLVAGEEPDAARLRLLYVEQDARGAGVGTMLVAACIDRARAIGYKRLDLWTNSVLTAARAIYERAGFRLVDEVPHRSFGHDLIGQTWLLEL